MSRLPRPSRLTLVLTTLAIGAAGFLLASTQRLLHAAPAPMTDSVRAVQSTPAAQFSNTFVAAAEAIKPSVVLVTAEVPATTDEGQDPASLPQEFRRFFGAPDQRPRRRGEPQELARASGSGFVVSKDGYILTNAHVVEGATRVEVRLLDRREYRATIVGSDQATDVAVLRIEAPALVAANLGSSDSSRVGEFVLAVGNPLGEELTFTVTEGIVSAKGRSLRLPNSSESSIHDYIQTDAAINPGNSGGPLVDMRGRVIGINSAIASGTGYYSGYGFAVPIDLARQVMRQLIDHGSVERAALGLQVRTAESNDATWAAMDRVGGVVVMAPPASGTPAAVAGVRAGDLIVAIDGQPIDYVAQLQERVGFRRPGEAVTIDIRRKAGEKARLTVRLTRLGADSAQVASVEGRDGAKTPERPTGSARLGIAVIPTNDPQAAQWHVPPDITGLVVMGVEPGADSESHLVPPSDRGVDVVLSVDGTAVHSQGDVHAALRDVSAGGVVSLEVYNTGARTRRIERVRLASAR